MIAHRYHVLESTNLKLAEMAARGAPGWTVVLADSQSGGMGRSGRTWWSPPGGLYMSLLIRGIDESGKVSRIPILACLAVLDALGETRIPASVKWPNDILVAGKKLAGILIQARTEGKKVVWVVAGFGINIHRPEGMIPEGITEGIAYAEDLIADVDRDRLAESIVTGLKKRMVESSDASWKAAMEEWTRAADWNAFYTHRAQMRETKGVPVRLAWDGGLVLRTDHGDEITVHSGEITEAVQSPGSRVQRENP